MRTRFCNGFWTIAQDYSTCERSHSSVGRGDAGTARSQSYWVECRGGEKFAFLWAWAEDRRENQASGLRRDVRKDPATWGTIPEPVSDLPFP